MVDVVDIDFVEVIRFVDVVIMPGKSVARAALCGQWPKNARGGGAACWLPAGGAVRAWEESLFLAFRWPCPPGQFPWKHARGGKSWACVARSLCCD